MSHFSLLVISPTELTEDNLEPILQPWHEYECTGTKDQYVVEVDITDEVLVEFNRDQKVVVLADGTVRSRWDEFFYTKTKKDAKAWDHKEFELPEGAREETFSAEEARKHGIGYATLEICAKEYHGLDEEQIRDGRYYKLTNPSSHWDCWQVGGRWSGYFRPKYDPDKDLLNQEKCIFCRGTGTTESGDKCPHCKGTGIVTKWPTEWANIGNIMQLKNIPIDELRSENEVRKLKIYDEVIKVIDGRSFQNWDQIRKAFTNDHEAARLAYWAQPVIKDLQALENWWDISDELDDIKTLSRDEFAAKARQQGFQTFAVVKDGEWYQRGDMGWWACVSNENNDWGSQFAQLIDGLSPDTWVAIVDCHI